MIERKDIYSQSFPTFVEHLRYQALSYPDRVALSYLKDGETEPTDFSYRELDHRARCVAARLQKHLMAGERALLLLPSGIEFITAFLGCLYAGVVAVPAYPPRDNHHTVRLHALSRDAGASMVLATAQQKPLIGRHLAVLGDLGQLSILAVDSISDRAELWQPPLLRGENLAFLQYTSGSTGRPKGVMVSHENILHNGRCIQDAFNLTDKSVGVGWLPMFHDMGLVGNLLEPLFVGFPVVLFSPASFLQKPVLWLQLITRYSATSSGGPSFAYEHCLNRIKPEQLVGLDLSSWEVAFNGAEPVRAQTIERFAEAFAPCGFRRQAFYPCYGMAECTLLITGGADATRPRVLKVDAAELEHNRVVASASAAGARALVSSGYPRQGQRVVVVDPDQRVPLGEGRVGEIWCAGPSVAQGYWNNPEETARNFGAFLTSGDGPFLRTGDLGFLMDGELYVTGRCKDLIIIRGRNHYPQDLEQTMASSYAGLRPFTGAAFTVEEDGEEQLVLVQEVERSALRKLDPEKVIAAIREAVLAYHEIVPHAVILIKPTSIPKTSSGKIQRHACREVYLTNQLDAVGSWRQGSPIPVQPEVHSGVAGQPSGRSEQEISRWLCENLARRLKLSVDAIDPREPFSRYGLDSLAAVSVTGELEEWLGRKLTPTLAYDYPTVTSLAHHLAGTTIPTSIALMAPPAGEPIAVIGMGCRFPGAAGVEQFWQLLARSGNAVSDVPTSRWNREEHSEDTRFGGFLDDVDQFDPLFFGISPREAQNIDPQQRLLLEVTWEALENAFIPPGTLAGTRTGVFVGISSDDYARLQYGLYPSQYAATGNAKSIAANRLSYLLDLKGPSLAIDTACSSSLVALHQACVSLMQRESELAIVAGVNLLLTPELSLVFSQAGMLASDGRCKSFDASADGYVRGEGCGVVLLKPLSQAVKDGNPILALVRGSAVNQDGRSNGITAPNGPSQESVIRQALENAGVHPHEVSYIETHGTGTSLGDPIEANTLALIFGSEEAPVPRCWMGSVKTNIGHLEAAAGIAGFIKTVLMLHHREIPALLHFQKLNPYIKADFELTVASTPLSWSHGGEPRIAGVSSFGFGGTNCHVVLQEPPAREPRQKGGKRGSEVLILSAPNPPALRELVLRYRELLMDKGEFWSEICAAAALGREQYEHRLAVVGDTPQELVAELEEFIDKGRVAVVPAAGPSVAFLFSGQGSQYAGMGRDLYHSEPVFRVALERCAAIADPLLDKPLLDVLFPVPGDAPLLDQTAFTQPALFALEYALTELWGSWGVRPVAVLGHSLGEYVAASLAGVLSLEEALQLVIERARLMQGISAPGAMIAVQAEKSTLRPFIDNEPGLSFAAINGPNECVISGHEVLVGTLAQTLESKGMRVTRLRVSHAFHSPLMDPLLPRFAELAARFSPRPPRFEFICNLTGSVWDEGIFDYWCRHLREPVLFYQGMRELERSGHRIFLEIGPGSVLTSIACGYLESASTWATSLNRLKSDGRQMLESLSMLYLAGCEIDWHCVYGQTPVLPFLLPNYPFQRSRQWFSGLKKGRETGIIGSAPRGMHPLLGRKLLSPLKSKKVFQSVLAADRPSYLGDHRVHGGVLFPGAAYLELALAAGGSCLESQAFTLEEVRFHKPLRLPEGEERLLQTVMEIHEDTASFSIYSLLGGDEEQWVLHASGVVRGMIPDTGDEPEPRQAATTSVAVSEFYGACRALGLDYGPAFQGVRQIEVHQQGACGRVELPETALSPERYLAHPAILDAAIQLVGAALPEGVREGVWIPVGVRKLTLNQPLGQSLDSSVRLCSWDNRTVSCDLTLTAPGGRRLACLEGVSLRRMPSGKRKELQKRELRNYGIVWRAFPEIKLAAEPFRQKGHWVIFCDEAGIGAELALLLQSQEDRVSLVFAGSDFGRTEHGWCINPELDGDYVRLLEECCDSLTPLHGIVHIWNAGYLLDEGASAELLHREQQLGCQSFWQLIRALAVLRHSPQLFLVTRQGQALGREVVQLHQAATLGLARVAATEHPELRIRCIDLEIGDSNEVRALFRELRGNSDERQVSFRGGVRHAARLVPLELGGERFRIDAEGSYLITGGLGGLGLETARWLVTCGARTVVLVGRHPDQASFAAELEQLRQGGARVEVIAVDVAHFQALEEFFIWMADSQPPLKGVFHAAGVLDDGLLLQTSWDLLNEVLRPKVAGGWNLHLLTRGLDLDFFVCYSSMASILGSPTQGGYAAANAFLDRLAHYRKGLGLPALTVNWGPWHGGGMIRKRNEKAFWQRMDQYGIAPLLAESALERMGDLLATGAVQGGPLAISWERFLTHSSDLFFSEFTAVSAGEKRSLVEASRGKSGAELERYLLDFLRQQLGRVLGVGLEAIPPHRTLNTLGLDSLMAFELTQRIQMEAGMKLPLIELLEGMTLEGVVRKLRNHLEGSSTVLPLQKEEPVTQETELVTNPGQLLAELHLLSDDEVELLLKQMQDGA